MCHGTVSSERRWQAEEYRCRLLRKFGRVESPTEQLQKIEAPHSMTSSARASSKSPLNRSVASWSALGHEEEFRPSSLSGCCLFGEATFAEIDSKEAVTAAGREWDTDGSGFMLLRRHLATAPSLRLGRPSASIGR
jgi:hypothetical protein